MQKLKDKSSPRGGRYSYNPTHLCTDSKGNILQASEGALDLTGKDLSQLIGTSIFDHINEESSQKLAFFLSDDFEAEKFSMQLGIPNGTSVRKVMFTIMREGKGNTRTLNWIANGSVSETQNGHSAFKPIDEATVLARIIEPVIAIDLNFQCNYINEAAAAFWSLKPGDIIGNVLWSLFPQLKDGLLQKNCEAAMVDHHIRSFEEHHSASQDWYLLTLYPSADGITIQYKNITVSKRAALSEELKHEVISENLMELNEIIEHSTEIIFKVDVQGYYTFFSSEVQRSLGYDPNELKGKYLTSIIHEDDRQRVMDVFFAAMRSHMHIRDIVYRLVAKDGSYRWFSCTGCFVFNADGSPAYALGLAQDISDLKVALKKLEDAEQRHLAFLQNSSEAIWRFEIAKGISIHESPENIIEQFIANAYLAECNKAFSLMYGYEDEKEMLGMPVTKIMSSDDPSNLSMFLGFIESGFKLENAESVDVDRFGQTKHILNNLSGIVEQGKLIRVWGTQRDITQLKVAEREISTREEQYRTLAENVPALIQRLDRELRFVYVNKAVKETFRRPVDGFLGKTMLELGLEPELWADLKVKAFRVFETGEANSFTINFPSLSTPNKKYHLLLNLTPEFDKNGKVHSIICIGNDITPIVKAQATLQYKDKLLAAVNEVTSALLRNADYRSIIPQAIERLGKTAATDRAYIFEMRTDESGILKGTQTYEWCTSGVSVQIDNPTLTDFSFDVFGSLLDVWEEGKPLTLFPDKITNESLRKELQSQDIKSMILIPIFVNQEVWGLVGFDDCTLRRVWTEEEKEAFKTFSASLAASISRSNSQKAIIESETRFRLMADNASVMMWVSNEEDELVYVNKYWTDYTGISAEKASRIKWSSIVHPDDFNVAIELYNSLIEKREPAILEYRLLNSKGEYRWMIDKSNPRFLNDGTFLGYIGSVFDIHDRKLMEEKLRFQARIMQEVSEAIIALDLNYTILSWNRGAELIYGVSAEESIGKSLQDIAATILVNDTIENSIDQLNKNGFWEGEAYFDRRDGRRVYLHSSVVYLTDDNGNRIGYVGNNRDITERRRSEDALRISEERYRTVVNALGEGIIVMASTGRIIACNKSAEQILGIKEEQMKNSDPAGVRWKSINENGIEIPLEQLPFSITMRTGHSLQNIIIGLYVPKGDLVWLSINTEPIYYSQKRERPDAVVASIVDITRKKRQQQLLDLEKEVLQKNAQLQVPLRTNIDNFLIGIEKLLPAVRCSVLTLNDNEQTISTLSAPNLPVEYTMAINGLEIGPQHGSCGTAMFTKNNVIVEDIATDPLWDNYRAFALKFGLRSCWSFPVINAQNKVLASFAFYKSEPGTPSEEEMVIIDSVMNILRVVIESKMAEEKIKVSNERYLLATMATNDAIWDWDVISNTLYWGEGFHTLFGYKAGYFVPQNSLWDKNIHPQDRDRVLSSLGHFIESNSQQVWQEEYRFKKADGKYVLVTDRGFLIYNQQGKITRMVGSMQDITDKREMERKLLKHQLNRQKLIAQAVVDAQEKERSLIGKELHDNVNQILSTAKLYLEVAKNDEKDRISLMDLSTQNISEAINEIRSISRSLVPASIGDIGLAESIQDLLESIKVAKTFTIDYHPQEGVDKVLSEQQKLMLFRIAQEQINNILKHAQAKHIDFELYLEDDSLKMVIADDGIGFDTDQVKFKKGVGLSNISSRADLFNGKVDIISAPGKGCKLIISVPISNQ